MTAILWCRLLPDYMSLARLQQSSKPVNLSGARMCGVRQAFLSNVWFMQIDDVVRGAATVFSALRCVDLRRCELLGSEALAFIAMRAFSQLQVNSVLIGSCLHGA